MNNKIVVGAITDFLLTGITAVMAIGHFPDSWGWFVAVGGATVASVKHVRGMLLDPKEGENG